MRIPLLVALTLSCQPTRNPPAFDVMRRFPHDTGAYTQGLVYVDGHLYESTGLLGQSQLREVDLQTGSVLVTVPLASDRFGEGLTLLNGQLFQLTWKSRIGYIYDAATLARVDSFPYAGEGWGLTTDGTSLIMSDGTARLRFLDPASRQVVGTLDVQDRGSPLRGLNELEYVHGEIYANVYPSSWIVRIDARTGAVRQWIDLADLVPPRRQAPEADVLNGIAYDEATGHLLVTGKRWPTVFELQLRRVARDAN